MAQAKRDPWLDIGEEVDATAATPAQSPAQPAAQPQDEFAAIGEPAQVVDTHEEVKDFGDQLPDQPAHTLAPDDEKELVRILSTHPLDTAAADARAFIASRGFSAGPGNTKLPGDAYDQVIAYRKQHGVVGNSVDYIPQPVETEAGGSLLRGIGDIGTSGFLDEAGAVVDTLGLTPGRKNVWNSDDPAGDLYDINLDQNRAIIHADERDHPVARLSGQLIGGLAIPTGLEGVGVSAGREAMYAARALGHTPQEALAIGRQAAARAVSLRMARNGTVIGGAHGIGAGESPEGRLGEGLAEAGVGAAGGAVMGAVGEAVAPRIAARAAAVRATPLTEEQELVRAADRQGIESILPADVGGPVTRRSTSMVSQTIAGGKPVIERAQALTEEAKAARDRIASDIGQALEPEAAGQQGITGAQKYIASSRNDARKYYGSAEAASRGVKIDAPQAVAELDQHISELGETPGGAPGLSTLQGLKDALAKGNLTVAGVRRMRTVLRDQFIKDGLTGSDLERRVNLVIDAAAEDVRDGLHAAGLPKASGDFAAGDAAWKARAHTIDTIIKPIIGTKDAPKSGEQVIKTLTADLQGNNARAIAFLKALPADEQDNVRASIIGAMGKAKPGQQGSEGAEFSLNTFLTNWNQVGERAKNAYFGPEARAALNDLAKIAEGTREAQGYRNMSNTGGVVGNLLTLFSGVGGIMTFGKVVGTQYALGRLLASPRFARWLARAPKAGNQQAYIGKLAGIARAEPAIAGDIMSIQQRLTDAFRSAPMKAAASDDKKDSEQTPR